MPFPKKIYRFETVGSTNEVLKELARKGEPEGTIVVADCQTSGRGREGRVWESPAGKNLYFSILLRPEIPAELAPQLTVMTGRALADFLKKEIPIEVTLKWPNDVYYQGKKLGGILCESEMKVGAHHDLPLLDFVVIGIGLNVNSTLDDFSDELQKTVTSLFLITKKEFDREKLLNHFLVSEELSKGWMDNLPV